MDYVVHSIAEEPIAVLWAAHPQVLSPPGTAVEIAVGDQAFSRCIQDRRESCRGIRSEASMRCPMAPRARFIFRSMSQFRPRGLYGRMDAGWSGDGIHNLFRI